MNNPEFIELRNRFLFGLFIASIVVGAGILLFSQKFGDMRSDALEDINSDKTFLLFVMNSKNCDSCDRIADKLDNLGVSYVKYNLYRPKDLDDVCFKLGITKENLKAPSLIYIKDGDKVGSLLNVSSDEMIESFLENYHFIME